MIKRVKHLPAHDKTAHLLRTTAAPLFCMVPFVILRCSSDASRWRRSARASGALAFTSTPATWPRGPAPRHWLTGRWQPWAASTSSSSTTSWACERQTLLCSLVQSAALYMRPVSCESTKKCCTSLLFPSASVFTSRRLRGGIGTRTGQRG